MKMIKLSDKISIEPAAYATQGNAILGLRGSGKSYSATYLAEQLMGEKIPFTAFDPIGVWRNLKVPGKGHGFPVVVVGEDADLPLNQKAIPDIIRATMREGINLVIDLYSLHLSKSDWRSIVENSVSIMLHENKAHGLRHIFVEEAAEFVPQIVRPDQAKVYSVFEKIARMGGNASLGYTLINQRAEAVNKEMLENCDMVFLHKQRGRNSVANLGKWLKSVSPATADEVMDSLPNLKAGECWILPADSATPYLVRMPAKQSFHPDRQNPTAARPTGKTVDVTSFVEKLKAALPKHEEKKATATKAVVHSPAPQPIIKEVTVEKIVEKIVEVPVLHDADRKFIMNLNELILELSNQTKALVAKVDAATMAIKHRPLPKPAIQPIRQVIATPKKPESSHVDSYDGNGEMKEGLRKILMALAQVTHPLSAKQVGVLSGQSSGSGAFNSHLAEGRRYGWIAGPGGQMTITPEGKAALGDFEPLPTGRALLEHWMQKLPDAAGKMLAAIAEVWPNELSSEELGALTNFSHTSGAFNSNLAHLRTLRLISQRGPIKATDEFFQ